MKKRVVASLICLLMSIFLLPTVACADMGPKPSVQVAFDGLGDVPYYATLLSQRQSTGPYSVSKEPMEKDSFLVGEHEQEDLAAWQAFRDYADPDGFYFIEYFKRCNEENTFVWSYYPPDTFKILLYFPQSGTFLTSDIQEKYAFDSYYRVTVSEDKASLTAQKDYDYSAELLSLVARILLTVTVEVGIALLFGLRRRRVLPFLVAVNFATQILLNVLLNVVNYRSGGFAFVFNYVWMELVVVLVEAVAFAVYFRRVKTGEPIKKWVAPVYAVVSNAASFVVGMMVAIQLPGIF